MTPTAQIRPAVMVLGHQCCFPSARATQIRGGSRAHLVTAAVRPEGVEKVKRAIQEFVPYVRAKEPGTRMYLAWQQQDDATRFVHVFILENEAAHEAHSYPKQ